MKKPSRTIRRVARRIKSVEPDGNRSDAALRIVRRGSAAFSHLLESRQYAVALGRSVWDFAVELEDLKRLGLLSSDLRWLVCHGYAETENETAQGDQGRRIFERNDSLSFSDRACFVLTNNGVLLTEKLSEQPIERAEPSSNGLTPLSNGNGVSSNGITPLSNENGVSSNGLTPLSNGNGVTQPTTPFWDRDRRELRMGDVVIKRFRVPAPNQEIVLVVFQEEGWPVRVDDPLPRHGELDPKRRLHDTINALNRNQKAELIHFEGDGVGQGVCWTTSAC